MKEMHQIT